MTVWNPFIKYQECCFFVDSLHDDIMISVVFCRGFHCQAQYFKGVHNTALGCNRAAVPLHNFKGFRQWHNSNSLRTVQNSFSKGVVHTLFTSLFICNQANSSTVKACWERADLLALVCGVFCELVTFPLVSWVRCGT